MRYIGRAARRHLDGLAGRRPRSRQVRRRPHRQQLREPQSGEHLLDQALQPLLQGRHRAAALPRVREVVGRPLPHEQGGDGLDRPEPVRRQQARRRRARVVRRQAPRRPAQRPLADHRVRLVGRQHHPAAAGARLDPRSLPERRRHPPQRSDDRLLPAREGRPPRPVRVGGRRPARDLRAGQRARADRHAAARSLRGDHRGHAPRHAGAGVHRGPLPDPVRAAHDRRHPRARRRARGRARVRGRRARVADQPGALRHVRLADGEGDVERGDRRGPAADEPGAGRALDAVRPQPLDDVGEGDGGARSRQPAARRARTIRSSRSSATCPSRSSRRSTGIETCATPWSSARSRRSTSRHWLAAAVGVDTRSAGASRPAVPDLGARGARAPQAEGGRSLARSRDAARRLGAAAHLRSATG